MPRKPLTPTADDAMPFYVYHLVDPRDGAVFYVGKGTKNRAWHHERDVRAGRVSNVGKSARIREILDAGLTVGVQIIARFADEAEAYDTERAAIRANERLTNVQSGSAKPETARERQIRELEGFKRDWLTFSQWRALHPNAPASHVEIAQKLHPWVDELLSRLRSSEAV